MAKQMFQILATLACSKVTVLFFKNSGSNLVPSRLTLLKIKLGLVNNGQTYSKLLLCLDSND